MRAFGVESDEIERKDVDLVKWILKIKGIFKKIIPKEHKIYFYSKEEIIEFLIKIQENYEENIIKKL